MYLTVLGVFFGVHFGELRVCSGIALYMCVEISDIGHKWGSL
jgi:hypothetical protein